MWGEQPSRQGLEEAQTPPEVHPLRGGDPRPHAPIDPTLEVLPNSPTKSELND